MVHKPLSRCTSISYNQAFKKSQPKSHTASHLPTGGSGQVGFVTNGVGIGSFMSYRGCYM